MVRGDRSSVGRFQGQTSRADASVADYDQRACGKVVCDLAKVRENDRSERFGSFIGAAEQDDARQLAADVEPLAVLSRFRLDFHACLTARGDELSDAVLCADGPRAAVP
jgi:hypothetical protein